jgi:hypothetical protein
VLISRERGRARLRAKKLAHVNSRPTLSLSLSLSLSLPRPLYLRPNISECPFLVQLVGPPVIRSWEECQTNRGLKGGQEASGTTCTSAAIALIRARGVYGGMGVGHERTRRNLKLIYQNGRRRNKRAVVTFRRRLGAPGTRHGLRQPYADPLLDERQGSYEDPRAGEGGAGQTCSRPRDRGGRQSAGHRPRLV